MRLNHLHLHVSSVARSREFYARFFGLRDHVTHGEILFMRDADEGMDLALAPAESVEPLPYWFHFGFRLPNAEQVCQLHEQMQTEGVKILQPLEELEGFVFFRCADPDGYAIEVYWE